MRVGLPTAGFLLTSAISSIGAAQAVTVNMSPPAPAKIQVPAKVPINVQAKVTCPCNCPKDHAPGHHAQARRVARHFFRHYAHSGYYRYGAAAPVTQHDWHGQWRAAPNDAFIPEPVPGPQAYGPPRYGYSQQDLQVDSRGWTGGVGDGGFVDGYGQVHFANGGLENGPTYNSYGQSFQYNPSQAGPFQPRSMGGYAPYHR